MIKLYFTSKIRTILGGAIKTSLYILIAYVLFSIFLVFIPSVYNDLYISSPSNKIKVAIIAPKRAGEEQQANMVREVAEKKGHLAYSFYINDTEMTFFKPAAIASEILIYTLDLIYKPDIYLVMSYHVNIDIPEPKVMYISVPMDFFKTEVLKLYPKVLDYNKFIDINYPKTDVELFPKGSQIIYGIVGVPENDFYNSAYGKILYFGTAWGRSKALLEKLSRKEYFYFLKHEALIFDQERYPQKFVDKADSFEEFQQRLNEYGIVLCLHSNYHLRAGVPSSRIFEAISSGAIVISDLHPFVIENFGENVLYIDQTLSEDKIIEKIENYYFWIKNNPNLVEIKAKSAHLSLQQKFTTEDFFNKFLKHFLDE